METRRKIRSAIRNNNLLRLRQTIPQFLNLHKCSKVWQLIVFELSVPPTQHSNEQAAAIMEEFVTAGLNINKTLDNGYTSLTTAIRIASINVLRTLIEFGANVNYWSDNRPVIVHAVNLGRLDIVICLLEHGATIGGTNETWFRSALCAAISHLRGNTEMINFLLDPYDALGHDVPWGKAVKCALTTPCGKSELKKFEDCAIMLMRRGYHTSGNLCSDEDFSPYTSCFYMATLKGFMRFLNVLVQQNPRILQEEWLMHNKLPAGVSVHSEYISWLLEYRSHPLPLLKLCKYTILNSLGTTPSPMTAMLPLPKILRYFLDE